jgi:cbb3-type cytochrome oxidase subunit 3
VIRLSELVSALTPAQYAELSLVLFLLVFAGVLLRHGGKRRAAEHAACAQLPLADDALPQDAIPHLAMPSGAMPLDNGVSR